MVIASRSQIAAQIHPPGLPQQGLEQIAGLLEARADVVEAEVLDLHRRSISFQVIGVETHARGCGRTEYTDASVRPHAFWL